jgi:hypothetical protein
MYELHHDAAGWFIRRSDGRIAWFGRGEGVQADAEWALRQLRAFGEDWGAESLEWMDDDPDYLTRTD